MDGPKAAPEQKGLVFRQWLTMTKLLKKRPYSNSRESFPRQLVVQMHSTLADEGLSCHCEETKAMNCPGRRHREIIQYAKLSHAI